MMGAIGRADFTASNLRFAMMLEEAGLPRRLGGPNIFGFDDRPCGWFGDEAVRTSLYLLDRDDTGRPKNSGG
jgi:hypothetical protein